MADNVVNVKSAAASWGSDDRIVEVTEAGFVWFRERGAVSILFWFWYIMKL